MRSDKSVKSLGIVDSHEVVTHLSNSKYYITTSEVENSYNAASEGIFLAQYSYISSIEPHKELVQSLPYELHSFKTLNEDMLFIKKDTLTAYNLMTWDQVIQKMLLNAELK